MLEITTEAVPDGARCANHPDASAVVTCERCGTYCGSCCALPLLSPSDRCGAPFGSLQLASAGASLAAETQIRDGGPCLEESYIWAWLGCDGEPAEHIARRVTLAKFCADFDCPTDWNAALALSGDCDGDAGGTTCWSTRTDCGVDVLSHAQGVDETVFYYDHADGEIIGAAIQLTDAAMECRTSEIIAGERPPICCVPYDAG